MGIVWRQFKDPAVAIAVGLLVSTFTFLEAGVF
jgi:hypothetical protein